MDNTVYIGAGCFWGTGAYYKKIKGVISAEAGYANGDTSNPTYEEVCNNSGHAEVVKVTYNPSKLSNEELFESYMRIINPFTKDRQGNDVGIQYRPGLYFEDSNLLDEFQKLLTSWEGKNKKTVIELLKLDNYTKAEEHHQDYLEKNPQGYCHINLNNIPQHLLK